MENAAIPNSTPVTGRTSTKSLARSTKRNSFQVFSFSAFQLFAQSFLKQTPNAERRTLNVQLGCAREVRRSMFDVGRSAFSFFRRVKGAWWPSRSSKPSLVPRMRDQGRFDSYPLRYNKFDVRWVMFEVVRTSHLQSNIKLQTSKIRERG